MFKAVKVLQLLEKVKLTLLLSRKFILIYRKMLLIFNRKIFLLWGSSSRNVVKIVAVSEIQISIMMEDLEFYSVPLGRNVMKGSKFFRQTFRFV